ncbi:hypothetical protein J31TS6_40270 [Brevibacillus reuszeri]|uniref:hypothetical protein n=1 Tax=Brevibacillus reuszeri TaxID=54915 RepID=UPI001B294111|nr:hypothetical protein [Brevibacillus reuszeri]GIO07999.1 hypothetical protein J31TS6_40270 [Brevibacillus reuszeri]
MENFISTFVIILPGIMAYFWLQSFGLNPPVKHTAPEVTGIAAMLWLPISFITLFLINLWSMISEFLPAVFSVKTAWDINEIKATTSDLRYLFLFISISAIVSFLLCLLWTRVYPFFLKHVVNRVRKKRKIADLDQMTTVWDDFFSHDRSQVVEIIKLDKVNEKETRVIGSISNFSRPFEPDKCVVLEKVEEWEKELNEYSYPVNKIYVDIKAGIIIKELDHENPTHKTKITTSLVGD